MQISTDQTTRKFLVQVDNKTCVETTYVDYSNKHIVCFSSMAGCPIGCTFCASSQNKTHRTLTTTEMVKQCHLALETQNVGKKPILFSCMGEGEPLLNYTNVIAAFKIMDKSYSEAKLALSTSGVKPYLIARLANEEFRAPFKLQISIHSTRNSIRKMLMPSAPSLSDICKYLPIYQDSGKSLEFNYALLDGINDSDDDAIQLAALANGIKIKLNMLNPIPNSRFQFTTRFEQFCKVLDEVEANYEFYITNGADINAACGQLTYTTGDNTNGYI